MHWPLVAIMLIFMIAWIGYAIGRRSAVVVCAGVLVILWVFALVSGMEERSGVRRITTIHPPGPGPGAPPTESWPIPSTIGGLDPTV